MLPSQSNQSILDSVRCLHAVAASETSLGVSQMARQLHLEPTRAHRLLKTLAHTGLLEQDARRRYRPGPGLLALASRGIANSPLWRHARAPLRELAAHLQRPAALGTLWDGKVSLLRYGISSSGSHRDLGQIQLLEASQSAIGLALLAKLDDSDVERAYLGRPVPGFPGGTAALLENLRKIRSQAYSWLPAPDHAEADILACPLADETAAVGIWGPLSEDEFPETVVMVKQAAQRIENPAQFFARGAIHLNPDSAIDPS